ncbi:hypothetical protein LZ32DRAFT_656702 [Colletotrichum eremochloae]|nr:hypothetical protein LZ32DRAFT_656702 [Colletotrichum eremochloae]
MHIDPSDPTWLESYGGRTYIGVPGFRVFHGQEPRPFNQDEGAWRVDGNPRSPNPLLLQMQRWGEQLYADGYVGTASLRLIIKPPKGEVGSEIRPENPGYVVRPPRGYTTAAGNLNPYELNFLMDNGAYSFVTAPPPPPPSKK